MAKKQGRRANRRIMDVRIADSASGQDGPRVDRMISAAKESESQMRMVIGDFLDLSSTTVDQNGSYSFANILSTDDFATAIQQYNLFRVRSIKFEIFDLNTGVAALNTWGIWHDNFEGLTPAYTRANTSDLPDSRVLSAGTGQTTLYWMAHGTAEHQFQAANTTGSPFQNYGGLRYFVGTNTSGAGTLKYSVQIHAVVDFRGRR